MVEVGLGVELRYQREAELLVQNDLIDRDARSNKGGFIGASLWFLSLVFQNSVSSLFFSTADGSDVHVFHLSAAPQPWSRSDPISGVN